MWPVSPSLRETFKTEYSKAVLDISESRINAWKKELKESFDASADHIKEIKKALTEDCFSLFSVYKLDLEKQSAYQYFLKRSEKALGKYFSKNSIELWNNLLKITEFYLKSF